MLHKWTGDTDGNSAIAIERIALFDFKKGFDLIDHPIFIQKLAFYKVPNNVVNYWIIDFLLNQKQESNSTKIASRNEV